LCSDADLFVKTWMADRTFYLQPALRTGAEVNIKHDVLLHDKIGEPSSFG